MSGKQKERNRKLKLLFQLSQLKIPLFRKKYQDKIETESRQSFQMA